MRSDVDIRAKLGRGPALFCVAIALLLFSTISIPVGSSVHSAIGGVLSSIPGVSVVGEVDTFSLTQTRYSDLNVVIPAAFLILASLAILNGKHVIRIRVNAIAAGFLVFSLVAAASACFFREYIEALKLAIYVLIAVAYCTFEEEERRRVLDALVSMCLVAGAANALVTIWQYGTMSSWSFTAATIRQYRPDGLFGDSIISALFCVVCIAVVLLRGGRVRLGGRVAIVGLCVSAGVVTGARTFYYLLGLLALYLMFAKTRNVSLAKKAALVVAAVIALILAVGPMGQSLIDALTTEQSVSSRELKQELAIEQFKGSPVLGIGTAQYASVEAAVSTDSKSGLHGTNPHNVYLQVLCENGIVGFVPLAASALAVLALAARRKNSLALILLLLYFAIAWSLGILYSVAFTSFFVALVCALLLTEVRV